MILQLVLLLSLSTLSLTYCPSDSISGNRDGTCYMISQIPMAFNQAAGECARKGGRLASNQDYSYMFDNNLMPSAGGQADDYWLDGSGSSTWTRKARSAWGRCQKLPLF